MVASVEPPYALLQEQVEALFGDPIEAPQMPLRLAPEVLDSIDVIALIDEPLRVVDPNMVEGRDIEGIVT